MIHGRSSFFHWPNPPAIDATFGVAELLERLGRERRADAAGAVDDDGRVAARDLGLDLALEVAARDVDRAGDGAGVVLVLLADVEERGASPSRASASVGGISVILAFVWASSSRKEGIGAPEKSSVPAG